MPNENPVTSKSAPKPSGATPRATAAGSDADELDRLRKENADLKARLAAAGIPVEPEVPKAPSFGMSEGTREELERTGKATDPFTGAKLTKEDLPD